MKWKLYYSRVHGQIHLAAQFTKIYQQCLSWYLFNKKSPLDRDKSHLCACMIPNWYFESPVALVWPGHPLAPDAPDPLYFSFNHSVMSISLGNKLETILVSCSAPWYGTELITYPSKGTKCHREITLEFLTPDKTYSRNGRRMGTRSSPRSLLCPKWRASWYMISMQGLGWLSYLQQKRFVLLSSSPNCAFLLDGWFHLLRSKGLWNDGSHGHCYKLQVVCLYYIYVCMVMLLYWWVFTRTLCRLLTDIDYMLTNVFVKLTLSCNHIKNQA